MALAKHYLLAACAGLCIVFCFATDGEAKKSIKPETAQERHRADGYGEQACNMAGRGRYQDGLNMLDLLIRQNSKSASLYAWRGRLLVEAAFDRGAPLNRKMVMKNAAADVARAQELDDTVSNIYYVRARLAVIDQYEENALPDLDKAIQYDPNNLPARLLRSQLLEGVNKAHEALRDLDVCVKLSPSTDTFSKRALIRRHIYDFKGAIEDYTSALKLAKAPFLYVKRGETYELAKQYDKAIVDCRFVLSKGNWLSKSDSLACRKRIARMLVDMKKFDEGKKELDIILKMNPEDMASIGKHLECAKKTKDWQAALADVNKLLEFETQYDGYYRERADIYRALGRADLAAADDKKAIELHKKNAGKLRYD